MNDMNNKEIAMRYVSTPEGINIFKNEKEADQWAKEHNAKIVNYQLKKPHRVLQNKGENVEDD